MNLESSQSMGDWTGGAYALAERIQIELDGARAELARLATRVAQLEEENARLLKNVAEAEDQWSEQQGELTYLRGEHRRMSQELRERRNHDAALLNAALARQRNLNKPEATP